MGSGLGDDASRDWSRWVLVLDPENAHIDMLYKLTGTAQL